MQKRVNALIANSLDDLQGANRKGISSIETVYKRPYLINSIEGALSIHVALLDVGIHPKVWRILHWTVTQTSSVLCGWGLSSLHGSHPSKASIRGTYSQ